MFSEDSDRSKLIQHDYEPLMLRFLDFLNDLLQYDSIKSGENIVPDYSELADPRDPDRILAADLPVAGGFAQNLFRPIGMAEVIRGTFL